MIRASVANQDLLNLATPNICLFLHKSEMAEIIVVVRKSFKLSKSW